MGKLAKTVYADALFDLAEEKEILEPLMEEVAAMRQILQENPSFCRLIVHPQLHKDEKEKLLMDIFQGRASDTMLGFLKLIVEKEHFRELPEIFEQFTQRYMAFHHIGAAVVTSAMELTEKQKQQIQKRLLETTSYREVRTEYRVDPSLLGGIVIRIGDRVVDGSIKNKLDQLTRTLSRLQLATD